MKIKAPLARDARGRFVKVADPEEYARLVYERQPQYFNELFKKYDERQQRLAMSKGRRYTPPTASYKERTIDAIQTEGSILKNAASGDINASEAATKAIRKLTYHADYSRVAKENLMHGVRTIVGTKVGRDTSGRFSSGWSKFKQATGWTGSDRDYDNLQFVNDPTSPGLRRYEFKNAKGEISIIDVTNSPTAVFITKPDGTTTKYE